MKDNMNMSALNDGRIETILIEGWFKKIERVNQISKQHFVKIQK